MKATFDREKLLAAFQLASPIAPARSPKPILSSVKLEVAGDSALLLATDLEIGIRVAVSGIQVESPGNCVLPIGRIGSILRESSDAQLRIETDSHGTIVRGDRSEFKLPAANPDEFPVVAMFNEKTYHELPVRLMRELIRRTVFATDNESTRYALGGVLLEMTEDKITAVGTDGRRLAKMEGPAKSVGGSHTQDQATIVPTRAMQMIERVLQDGDTEAQIAARGNDVLVKTSRATIFTRLVEGRFPKWRDVFPRRENASRIEMVVGPFLAAVRQAQITTSEESRGVDFTFGNGSIVLTAKAADVGQARIELPIAYDGPSISIMLDPRFMSDFLRVLDPDKTFAVEIKDAESAAVCSTDDGYGYVIMPLARDHETR